jgi:LPS sulfotransferase NodH
MNIKLVHLRQVFRDERQIANFLKQQNHLVHVRRRDKIEQAISLYRALSTGIFSSVHARFARKVGLDVSPPRFDAAKIDAMHNRVCKDDQAWVRLLENYQLKHYEVFYEDFTADMKHGCREVLSNIGINPPDNILPLPYLEKQSDNWNLEVKAQYLEYLRRRG